MKIFTPYPFDCAEISSVPDREGASGIVFRKHMLVVCGGLNGNNGSNGVEKQKMLAPKCSIIWYSLIISHMRHDKIFDMARISFDLN